LAPSVQYQAQFTPSLLSVDILPGLNAWDSYS